MNPNSPAFAAFLRTLGVQLEKDTMKTRPACPASAEAEPTLTVLQRARDHEALYRIDLLATEVHLLVLIPADEAPLRFHFYRVQWNPSTPLSDLFVRLLTYRGSTAFEQEHAVAEWQLLQAQAETMKTLFWSGFPQTQFPDEILVHKLA